MVVGVLFGGSFVRVSPCCLGGVLVGVWLLLIDGPWLGVVGFFDGEFDPGSGRTLAACLTHASRAVRPQLVGVHERRTGE